MQSATARKARTHIIWRPANGLEVIEENAERAVCLLRSVAPASSRAARRRDPQNAQHTHTRDKSIVGGAQRLLCAPLQRRSACLSSTNNHKSDAFLCGAVSGRACLVLCSSLVMRANIAAPCSRAVASAANGRERKLPKRLVFCVNNQTDDFFELLPNTMRLLLEQNTHTLIHYTIT